MIPGPVQQRSIMSDGTFNSVAEQQQIGLFHAKFQAQNDYRKYVFSEKECRVNPV